MNSIRCKIAAAAIAAVAMTSGMAYAQTAYSNGYPPLGSRTHAFSGRSDYYRANPREDPEPVRCTYAADSTCPGRYDSGFNGDPRDDPEPFRCTYAADQDCPNGGKSGIQ
jgi:hypothetical protein